jgi:hypothetical protein
MARFGVSMQSELLLDPTGPFRAILSSSAVDYLSGRYSIESEPLFLARDDFLRAIGALQADAPAKPVKPHSLSIELLERAVFLQKQKKAERKQRRVKPQPETAFPAPIAWVPVPEAPPDAPQEPQKPAGQRKVLLQSSKRAAVQMDEQFLRRLPHRQRPSGNREPGEALLTQPIAVPAVPLPPKKQNSPPR